MVEKNHDNGCSCGDEHLDHECGEDCGCGDDCGCDHGHDHEEEYQQMFLSLENGEELACFVLGVFDIDGEEYIALVPEDDETVFLYRYAEEDGEPVLTNIDDDKEFELVSEAFRELFSDDDEDEFEEEEDEE